MKPAGSAAPAKSVVQTPPAASGVHIAQMLNILEGYDIAKLGFGSAETIHYLAEVLKIAFADRAAASGDPDFINVPVERLSMSGATSAAATSDEVQVFVR